LTSLFIELIDRDRDGRGQLGRPFRGENSVGLKVNLLQPLSQPTFERRS
jgi:hypothetical protein